MTLAPELVSALIGFGGAILGGLIQSAFSWRQSHTQFVRDSRTRDYELFVEAIAGLSQAQGAQERKPFVARSIEAKAKIILSGSPAVVRALDRHSKHDVLASEESYADFCSLIAAMRQDLGGVGSNDLRRLTRSIMFSQREST